MAVTRKIKVTVRPEPIALACLLTVLFALLGAPWWVIIVPFACLGLAVLVVMIFAIGLMHGAKRSYRHPFR